MLLKFAATRLKKNVNFPAKNIFGIIIMSNLCVSISVSDRAKNTVLGWVYSLYNMGDSDLLCCYILFICHVDKVSNKLTIAVTNDNDNMTIT